MDTYILEVAIGKYVINRGDSLSKIAWKNHTTVERLLELNSNIIDPNMIYHGEYLVVK
ncbi:MAG: LysM peptidoglycan-binding domain-containing protein [Clostridia bacterium]|nr:LysM peptidoglycan-binding domain-containing protein [Clostridia bacterium]